MFLCAAILSMDITHIQWLHVAVHRRAMEGKVTYDYLLRSNANGRTALSSVDAIDVLIVRLEPRMFRRSDHE